MTKYHIVIKEVLIHAAEIEASTEEEARDIALELDGYKKTECVHYDVEFVREVEDQQHDT